MHSAHPEPAVQQGKGGPTARRAGRRRLKAVRKKPAAAVDWRLVDEEFDRLHQSLNFTFEACCDDQGLNGHANLPYCSPANSVLDKDLAGERVFMNPPFKEAVKMVRHLRLCHQRDPKNTRALVVLPGWACNFDKVTEGLSLYEEKPARTQLFTRSPVGRGAVR